MGSQPRADVSSGYPPRSSPNQVASGTRAPCFVSPGTWALNGNPACPSPITICVESNGSPATTAARSTRAPHVGRSASGRRPEAYTSAAGATARATPGARSSTARPCHAASRRRRAFAPIERSVLRADARPYPFVSPLAARHSVLGSDGPRSPHRRGRFGSRCLSRHPGPRRALRPRDQPRRPPHGPGLEPPLPRPSTPHAPGGAARVGLCPAQLQEVPQRGAGRRPAQLGTLVRRLGAASVTPQRSTSSGLAAHLAG